MNFDQAIMNMIKGYDPMYKPEKIKVNLSSSFMARARCKECGEPPSFYYSIRLPHLWGNPKHEFNMIVMLRKWIKRFANDWYMDSQPRYFHSAHDFDTSIEGKGYNPKLYRTRNANPGMKNHVVEVLGCDCGASVWYFNQKSVSKRPEISNRKGKYGYPKPFEF